MSSRHDETTAPASVSAQLAALGPFFAAEFHDPAHAVDAPWQPLGELLDDPGALAGRVAAVREYLASGTGRAADAIEERVAASVVHLGLVARVVTPLFALSLVRGRTARVAIRELRWQPTLGSMFPLSLPEGVLAASDGAEVVLDGAVAELDATMARWRVNAHILRGNTASALGGAAKALGTARPDLAAAAWAAVSGLLGHPALAGSAHLEQTGTLRRTSCCLIYRAAPGLDGSLCGDCVLASRRALPRI